MPVFLVTYDTKNEDMRKAVREGKVFVSESVYLVSVEATASQLLRRLAADIASAKKMRHEDVTLDNFLSEGERLVVVEAGQDWDGRGDGVDFAKIEEPTGAPRGT